MKRKSAGPSSVPLEVQDDEPARPFADLHGAALEASALMKALANPDRLLLMCHLAGAEHNVGELQVLLGIVQPTLSQQLAVLRQEGLVATRREGKNIYYRVASPQVLAVLEVLHAQYCAPGPSAGKGKP